MTVLRQEDTLVTETLTHSDLQHGTGRQTEGGAAGQRWSEGRGSWTGSSGCTIHPRTGLAGWLAPCARVPHRGGQAQPWRTCARALLSHPGMLPCHSHSAPSACLRTALEYWGCRGFLRSCGQAASCWGPTCGCRLFWVPTLDPPTPVLHGSPSLSGPLPAINPHKASTVPQFQQHTLSWPLPHGPGACQHAPGDTALSSCPTL